MIQKVESLAERVDNAIKMAHEHFWKLLRSDPEKPYLKRNPFEELTAEWIAFEKSWLVTFYDDDWVDTVSSDEKEQSRVAENWETTCIPEELLDFYFVEHFDIDE